MQKINKIRIKSPEFPKCCQMFLDISYITYFYKIEIECNSLNFINKCKTNRNRMYVDLDFFGFECKL